jgi:ketosteroid isomerase-like protein
MIATLVTTVCMAWMVSASGASSPALAAAPPPDSLYHEIQALDDSLSATFNAHEIDALMALFASDVEFYHDAGGLQHFNAVKAGFTSLFAKNNGIRRERVGALEAYPIPDFGAIEIGTHRFCHEENGRTVCGTFKFVHVWRRRADGWKLARVVSYGH